MRLKLLRLFLYAFVVLAGRGLAQSALVSVSDEAPHVELSVGAAAMVGGPGADFERRFRAIGFDAPDGRIQLPHTAPPAPLPGAFAQVHVATSAHSMVGFLISDVETETEGRPPGGVGATVQGGVRTRALIVSYRPNAWFKIGAGPALHRRSAGFGGHPQFREEAFGWVESGEVKFARRHRSPDGPPAFGYVLGQHRHARPLDVPSMTMPFQGTGIAVPSWPAQRVRTSHWVFGVGVGFEI